MHREQHYHNAPLFGQPNGPMTSPNNDPNCIQVHMRIACRNVQVKYQEHEIQKKKKKSNEKNTWASTLRSHTQALELLYQENTQSNLHMYPARPATVTQELDISRRKKKKKKESGGNELRGIA